MVTIDFEVHLYDGDAVVVRTKIRETQKKKAPSASWDQQKRNRLSHLASFSTVDDF